MEFSRISNRKAKSFFFLTSLSLVSSDKNFYFCQSYIFYLNSIFIFRDEYLFVFINMYMDWSWDIGVEIIYYWNTVVRHCKVRWMSVFDECYWYEKGMLHLTADLFWLLLHLNGHLIKRLIFLGTKALNVQAIFVVLHKVFCNCRQLIWV